MCGNKKDKLQYAVGNLRVKKRLQGNRKRNLRFLPFSQIQNTDEQEINATMFDSSRKNSEFHQTQQPTLGGQLHDVTTLKRSCLKVRNRTVFDAVSRRPNRVDSKPSKY